MTVDEAYKIFKSKYANLVIKSCYEYDSRFVFEAVHPKYADATEDTIIFDCLYSVEKESGNLTPFKPFDIPANEYKRGQKVALPRR